MGQQQKHILAEYPPLKYLCAACGLSILVSFGIGMGLTMGVSVLWFIKVHEAKETAILFHPQSKLSNFCLKYYKRILRYREDIFIVNSIIFGAILVPSLLFSILYIYNKYDGYNNFPLFIHIIIWYIYNMIRIGPAAMHFAYMHTLVHKEGHSRAGFFIFKANIINNIFNYWIGLFYGLLPGTYAYGHSVIHHIYNNLKGDVMTTAWGPRDNIINYFAYVIQFFVYHLNITTLASFYNENNMKYFRNVLFGNVVYTLFYITFYVLSGYHFYFVFFYLTYPMMEGMIFLSSVNWAWHLFLDPADINNEYVSSITLFDGPSNVLNEDYHVVHHAYPAVHWSKHHQLFEKHKQQYIDKQATVFRGTHAVELWIYSVTRQYSKMAKKYDKSYLNKNMQSLKDIEELLKTRLRTTFYNHDNVVKT